LNRISLQSSKEEYGEEELVAELGSAFLSSLCGISNSVLDNQAAYLDGWITMIGKEPNILIRASIHARKAVDYLANDLSSLQKR
jgi:antirestriction protein ArdC